MKPRLTTSRSRSNPTPQLAAASSGGPAGYSRVIGEVSEMDLARLRQAEELCPTASITVDVLDEPPS